MQEYTIEFYNQALVLKIDENGYEVFMKYNGGLVDDISNELKLFTVKTIEDVTVKAITIKVKNK